MFEIEKICFMKNMMSAQFHQQYKTCAYMYLCTKLVVPSIGSMIHVGLLVKLH